MRRKIDSVLSEWRSTPGQALVLEGPRQVGKTYAMKNLAKAYGSSVYINLEDNEELKAVFEHSNNADKIYEELSFHGLKFDLTGGKPLFIIDEIQSCSKAFSALKPLAVDGRCDVIASGSLLGVGLSDENFLSPLGYVRLIDVGPMDFEEFLWALGIEEDLTEKLATWIASRSEISDSVRRAVTEYFRKFMVVGGMPAAVKVYAETKDYNQVWSVLGSIYGIIRADVMRYSNKKDKLKILACLESVPSQLARENKDFIYKDVEKISGSGKREYGSSLDWLQRAGLVIICRNLKDLCEPLAQMERSDSFKVYLRDSGILTFMLGRETAVAVETGDIHVNQGAVMESCIAQALCASGYAIHFYAKSSSLLKMDFIISYEGKLTALEVKSGRTKRSRSLLLLMSGGYRIERGIKIADSPAGTDEKGILHLPLFAPSFFRTPRFAGPAPTGPEAVDRALREM